MKKLKLKRLDKDEEYDPQLCAVSRCDLPSEVIDATDKLSKKRIPLCDKHWKIRAEG